MKATALSGWDRDDWFSFLEEVEQDNLLSVCARYGVQAGDAVRELNKLQLQTGTDESSGERERQYQEREGLVRLPWSRLQHEGPNAFEAFKRFLSLGPTRTIEGAFRDKDTPETLREFGLGTWCEWATKCAWQERAQKHDQFIQLEHAHKAAAVCVDSIAKRARLYELLGNILTRELAIVLDFQVQTSRAMKDKGKMPESMLDTKMRPVIPGATMEQGMAVRYAIQLLKQYHLDTDRLSDLATGNITQEISARTVKQGAWAYGPTPRATSKAPAAIRDPKRQDVMARLAHELKLVPGGKGGG